MSVDSNFASEEGGDDSEGAEEVEETSELWEKLRNFCFSVEKAQ
jgi:hypothetical protein